MNYRLKLAIEHLQNRGWHISAGAEGEWLCQKDGSKALHDDEGLICLAKIHQWEDLEPVNPRGDMPHVLEMLTHDQGMKDCIVCTSTAIHTVKIKGKHFAALVINQSQSPCGAVALLDRQEVEAQIALLKNAIEDAERMDEGKAPLHAAHSLERN